MKLLAIAAACLLALSGTAQAQESDDWEFGEDPARQISAAVTRYDSGHAFVVQCRAGELTVAISGLAVGEGRRDLDVSRYDGRRDRLKWQVVDGSTMRAEAAGRAARLMRGGGVIQLRSRAGAPAVRAAFELPTESSNLDRVLTACGRPLQDERDGLPLFEGTLDRRSHERALNRGDVQTPPTEGAAAAEITCLVGEDLRLADCLVHQSLPTGSIYGLEKAERMTGVEVVPAEGQAAPGTVFHWNGTNMLIVVERVEIERVN